MIAAAQIIPLGRLIVPFTQQLCNIRGYHRKALLWAQLC